MATTSARSLNTARKRITKLVATAQHLYGPDLKLQSELRLALAAAELHLDTGPTLPGFDNIPNLHLIIGNPTHEQTLTAILTGTYWDIPAEKPRRPTALPGAVLSSTQIPHARAIADATHRAITALTNMSKTKPPRPTNTWVAQADNMLRVHKIPTESYRFLADWVRDQDGNGPDTRFTAAVTNPYGLAAIAPRLSREPRVQKAAQARGITLPTSWPDKPLNTRNTLRQTHYAHTPPESEHWGETRNVAF